MLASFCYGGIELRGCSVMTGVEDEARQQELLTAIKKAIGDRIENDDIDASVRARACLLQACIEIAHINNDVMRGEVLSKLDEAVRKMVSAARVLVKNPPKDP